MSIPGSLTPLFNSGGGSGYQVSRSIRLNASDSAYLSRTPASAGNRKTWTWSGWVKRSALGGTQVFFGSWTDSSNTMGLMFNTSNQLFWDSYSSGSLQGSQTTSAVFRDTSAWYHIVWAVDTTDATAANRSRIYVNGTEVAYAGATNPSQNADLIVNRAASHTIGNTSASAGNYFSGYLADIHFIDGQALTPSSFAETNATTGQWVPKAYTGSYGTNGFRLDFSDNSAATATTLGKDRAGSNNWTPNNLSVFDGIASVAAATGALPIYNTTDTYGTTKGSGTRTDPNASSLVLAISMDGANGGTTFTDDSPTIRGSGSAKTITRFNATTSSASSKFYGSSGAFNGTNAYLSLADSPDWAFGTSDFTVETWAYVNPGSALFFGQGDGGSPAWVIYGNLHIGPGIWSYNFGPSTPTGRWFHWAMVRQGTSVWFYIDGFQYGPYTGPSSWSDSTDALTIGQARGQYTNGYFQDFRIYKGVAKYTSNFNPPSSTQNPTVAAGNDSLVDTPTSYGTDTGAGGEVRGNYATLNPLVNFNGSTLSNGNLDITCVSLTGQWRTQKGGWGFYGGKFYFEATLNAGGSAGNSAVGIGRITLPHSGNLYPGQSGGSYAYGSDGSKIDSGSASYPWSTWTVGDVIGVAADLTAGTVAFYKNGTLQGSMTGLDTTLTYEALVGSASGTPSQYSLNFGQRPFAFPVSGFKALCDTSLPAPTIARPSTVMDVKLYTGNGSTQTISGLGFSPDLVWIKMRSKAYWHELVDTVRGANKSLFSNATDAEATINTVTAFNSDGFSVGTNGGANGGTNEAAGSYVAWAFDAGSSTVSNTQGSITSQVRANASAGFSIVGWTGNGTAGATVGHGLGAKPFLRIIKRRDAVSTFGWMTFHESAPSSYFTLNSTNAATPASEAAPTSSVFSLPADANSNASGGTYVAYCFAPVAGYSSMGAFSTATASTDGVFVYTNHRPRWVLIKKTSATGPWIIYDAVRNTYNAANNELRPNTSEAENGGLYLGQIDILSNGFKIRSNSSAYVGEVGDFVYCSFAESPFQYARAR